jgi:type II secretory pathway pseudopilin PulG
MKKNFPRHKHFPHKREETEGGFTYIELMLVGLIIFLITGGIWAVYYSVVNTYHEEQRGVLIQAEGERIINLITQGGNYRGRRIYGLSSSTPASGYPNVGQITAINFPNTQSPDSDDYRIEFALESSGENPRYAEFSVEFNGKKNPTSKLWFRLRTPSLPDNRDGNYDVLLTENFLQRKTGTNPEKFGNYEETWFKTQPLANDGSYYSGIKASFYLVDTKQPLLYNYRLDRELITPIDDAVQRKRYLDTIPYPNYFSTAVYFMNRE